MKINFGSSRVPAKNRTPNRISITKRSSSTFNMKERRFLSSEEWKYFVQLRFEFVSERRRNYLLLPLFRCSAAFILISVWPLCIVTLPINPSSSPMSRLVSGTFDLVGVAIAEWGTLYVWVRKSLNRAVNRTNNNRLFRSRCKLEARCKMHLRPLLHTNPFTHTHTH